MHSSFGIKNSLFKSGLLLEFQLPAGHGVTQVVVHRESGLAGRSFGELVAKGVVILGLQREDGTFVNLPEDTETVRPADEIFYYGPDQVLAGLGAVKEQLETNRG